MNWKHKVKIRHLFTQEETPEAVSKSMIAIGKILQKDRWFKDFDLLEEFFVVDDLDGANDLLDQMYNYCDAYSIWVEI